MRIIIEIPDKFKEMKKECLDYFYQVCLDNPELEKFSVEVEDLKKKK